MYGYNAGQPIHSLPYCVIRPFVRTSSCTSTVTRATRKREAGLITRSPLQVLSIIIQMCRKRTEVVDGTAFFRRCAVARVRQETGQRKRRAST